jgi:Transglutaminase-like superfamily
MTQRAPSSKLFRAVWYTGNILLILAVLVAAYSAVWEYSTRRYLKGFSDAVVPASASTEAKVQAILNWMSNGPARQQAGPDPSLPDRDPTETLNYASLLKVCGSATNAFVNLADSAGLAVRRLLLLDSHHLTKHVVAEVLVDGRWIVVDPAFRTILRGADGSLLTRQQLVDPAIFSAATRNIHDYDPIYTFDHGVHVRIARLGVIAAPLRAMLNRILPGWEDSTAISLLMERESMATIVVALLFVFLLGLLRVGLRWYGERRLGIRPVRIRQQVRRAFSAFVDTAS